MCLQSGRWLPGRGGEGRGGEGEGERVVLYRKKRKEERGGEGGGGGREGGRDGGREGERRGDIHLKKFKLKISSKFLKAMYIIILEH